jgi:hypothetical protein
MLSHIFNQTLSNLNLTILTLELNGFVFTMILKESEKSHLSLMFLQIVSINLRQLLPLVQSQLLSKLTKLYSNLTLQESSLANYAGPALIMESSLSDMELKMGKITSSLKTHGQLHGETMDTSKLELTTFAVSSNNHHTQLRLPQFTDFRNLTKKLFYMIK